MSQQRREILRQAMQEAARLAKKNGSRGSDTLNRAWFRPPFALDESDFLAACTRCNACELACPYGIIFPLSTKTGILLARTPAMDLLNKACRLCPDWPCVNACPEQALNLPKVNRPLDELRMAQVFVDEKLCLAHLKEQDCHHCLDRCPVSEAMDVDEGFPRIDVGYCVGCAQCLEACMVEPRAIELVAC